VSNPRAVPLTSPVRHYPWGSRTVLPGMLGEATPTTDPWAEIWIGAHPMDPSRLPDGRSLADLEPGLPFLVKLLAAAEPLSIQAHPNLEQARAGYAQEQARGIPLAAGERSYKDMNHKPELFLAFERTHALCGFRPPSAIVATADRLGSARFAELVAPAGSELAPEQGLRVVFQALMRMRGGQLAALVAEVVQASGRMLADPDQALRASAGWVLRLAEKYPADAGVLAAVLLDLVVLEPGDAVFVDAGVLHAYLDGAGVEVQASSDNVLRGGLTAKHIDAAELLSIVRYEVGSGHLVRPRELGPGLDSYPVPVTDFAVWRARPAATAVLVPAVGPRIAVCVAGRVEVCGTSLTPGRAAYVPASVDEVVISGAGTCFVAAPGTSADLAPGPVGGT
jgi:mannose-6-phosphate isomerase